MASLQICGTHVCGGFLIREDFVLTAAHCRQSSTMTVVLGAHNITRKEPSQQRMEVDEYFEHPHYNGKFNDDIMLLKLKTNAKLNKFVKIVALPRKNGKIPANIKCSVSGWGKTGPTAVSSDVLKEATEKLQFTEECKHKWQESFNSATMICTTFDKKSGGICQGDSGGPLFCNKTPQGIAAFTACEDCDNPKYPHVFTKISFYIPWIEEVLKRSENIA
ncbi:granzyme-like protein 1 isoform X1 [Sphaeramia orbicularis]|uniref:granzyme-like protein 1 isoform X1 n=1 Tax=Sphaeramia orbicularis TaxID=375764 RepID=UPI00117D01F0|nr:granzyme-like protein 1 isoform X1 [Sphaeramia orbicularis]